MKMDSSVNINHREAIRVNACRGSVKMDSSVNVIHREAIHVNACRGRKGIVLSINIEGGYLYECLQ